MERKKASRLTASIILLIVIYLFAIAALFYGSNTVFNLIFSFNILFSLIILFLFHKGWHLRVVLALAAIVMAGFLIELVGVNTGKIFGNYQYGASLGFEINGTPLIVGFHWLLLVYTTHVTIREIGITRPWIELTGAGLMTAMDYLIEPVAMKYELWQWEGGDVPLQNFVAWFYLSFLMHFYINRVKPIYENKIAMPTFIVILIFFITLNIL
ncbi:MAG: carotenoid biosynthesis protein [Chitinophagales bacterium]|nr:carotenoid biosynthesis protein [Chitinophagales bacterium]